MNQFLALLFFAWVKTGQAQSLTLPDPVGTPPKRIYHFSRYEILQENIQARTVPEESWRKYILGEVTRFRLPRYRRGLYGSGNPGDSVTYGDTLLGGRGTPWFIEITIRDECLTRKNILDYFPNQIYADPKFKKYILEGRAQEFKTLDDVLTQCFPTVQVGNYTYRDSTSLPLYRSKSSEGPCEQLVREFMDESNTKVVADYGWQNSWYIRDRNCIENIRGSESEMLEMMKSIPGFWNAEQLGEPLSEETENDIPPPGSSYPFILIKALSNNPHPNRAAVEILKKVKNETSNQQETQDYLVITKAILKAAIQCGTEPKFKILSKKFLDYGQETETGRASTLNRALKLWAHRYQKVCAK